MTSPECCKKASKEIKEFRAYSLTSFLAFLETLLHFFVLSIYIVLLAYTLLRKTEATKIVKMYSPAKVYGHPQH